MQMIEFNDTQRERYSRHILIPELGEEGQHRLQAAKVLCVGAGGLGSPALLYLAAAGVGTIGIVEFDSVELSNLQRQIIHGTSDIGSSKAHSAAASIAELNPDVRVNVHEVRLDASNALELITQYDVVIDGTDNFPTRYLVNDACVLAGKPYVWGSVLRFEGQASVFWAEHGPCYRCVFPVAPAPGMVPSCAEAGVLGAVCATIGSVQVIEAVKLITGIGEPLVGRIHHLDALASTVRTIEVKKNPECELCGPNARIRAVEADQTAINAEELITWLDARAAGERDFVLVDVREPAEHAQMNIRGSELIPIGEFANGVALSKLDPNQHIVLYCRTGGRSGQALAVLRQAGYAHVVHLDGGIVTMR